MDKKSSLNLFDGQFNVEVVWFELADSWYTYSVDMLLTSYFRYPSMFAVILRYAGVKLFLIRARNEYAK